MNKADFNPNDVSIKNGAFMSLDYAPEEADLILFPIPWDVTTSFRPGTSKGPQTLIDCSYQLDFSNPFIPDAWNLKIATLPVPSSWLHKSQTLRQKASRYIQFLENGGDVNDSREMQDILAECNEGGHEIHSWARSEVLNYLKQGKKIITIGGDHSVSLGPIQAHAEQFPGLSLLHFDAHADLRVAYEGFEDSHASILYNVMKNPSIRQLTQIGIRDYSPGEVEQIQKDPRIKTYFDWNIKTRLYAGESWDSICSEVIESLGPEVYITFDIDGLDPKLCPNTGTPVPGGLELEQAVYLIHKVRQSGRKIVGADLVEVAPSEWDGNVGARLLFQLCLSVFDHPSTR
jgi:agmatinase